MRIWHLTKRWGSYQKISTKLENNRASAGEGAELLGFLKSWICPRFPSRQDRNVENSSEALEIVAK